MFPGFSDFNISVDSSVTIHGIVSGDKSSGKPALLLLHGCPQTHHIWHRITPQLISEYTIVAIDLRGYGASSKPPSGAASKHVAYAKSTMARDCVAVMTSLGLHKFYVVGHDRGGRVAHKLCVDHPEKVRKVIVLDICPTLAMYEQTSMGFAIAYWHWFYFVQPEPLPENTLLQNQDLMKGKLLSKSHDEATMKIYAAQFGDAETVHGMCEDYRAAATIDLEEAKEDIKNGRQIQCPLRVLWGKQGVVAKFFDPLKEWKNVSNSSVDGESVDSGHFVPEEAPEAVLKHIKEFLV
ncbi:Alpha/Beta hydrolase protein [Xylogone sp. PMI_703]|nr:Alpha/Beta hydrolase protein [Xylogone sp. PMI_703]